MPVKVSQDTIDAIEALLITRQWSGRQIAEMLGRSRNSVVGIIWRTPHLREIGLPNEQPEALAKIVQARREASSERRMRWAPRMVPDYVKPGPRTLLNLRKTDCKYPVEGDGVATLFCAEVREGESSYCGKHRKLCVARAREGAR